MRYLFVVIVMLFNASGFAQNADRLYEDGKKLYDAKKYTEAFPKLKAAAEKGHKKAQYRLGRCFDKGNGTEENDNLAFMQGEKLAVEVNLLHGMEFYNQQGVRLVQKI